MTATSPSAFMLSATLHALVMALILLIGYVANSGETPPAKVLELVAGEGDNFAANEAPALGIPGGIKVPLTKAPELPVAPPEPVKAEPVPEPLPPVPTPPTPPTPPPAQPTPVAPTPKPADQAIPDFKKDIKKKVAAADRKAKKEVAAEKKRVEDEQKKMTKEEFDRTHKTKSGAAAAGKSSPTKVAKIDSEGIAKGVVGGSTKNKTGGAGGKALANDNTDQMASYFEGLKSSVRQKFEPPPGLSDTLKVDIELRCNADGTLTNVRVTKSSGSADFDRAVLDAIRRVKMPPRYDKKSDNVEFTFSMREKGEG